MATKTAEDVQQVEKLLRDVRSMVNAANRVVSAKSIQIGDPSAPQTIEVSEDGGSLSLGSDSPLRIFPPIVEEVSHTGDVLETELGKITVPGNSMGPRGFVRISAIFFAIGAANHDFRIYFGGNQAKYHSAVATNWQTEFVPILVWSIDSTVLQGVGINRGYDHWRLAEGRRTFSVDTTQDVDVSFTGENANPADTVYLRFALVEAFYSD